MLETFVGYLKHDLQDIISRLINFFTLPFENNEMTWVIIPVVLTIIIMEFYYLKNRGEETGWNTATANSLILLFVAADLFRFLYNKGSLTFSGVGSNEFSLTILVSIVLLEGLFMFFLDFTHIWPRFMAFHFSSHLTINLIAYISIVAVYGNLLIYSTTIAAALAFFILINIVSFLLRFMFGSKY